MTADLQRQCSFCYQISVNRTACHVPQRRQRADIAGAISFIGDTHLIETVVEQTPAEVVEERLADPEPAPVAPEAVSAKALTELLRVGSDFNLADVDPSSTPGFEGERADAEATMVDTAEELGEWIIANNLAL